MANSNTARGFHERGKDEAPQLAERLRRNDEKLRRLDEGDVVIEQPRRLFMRDTNGIYWRLEVSTAGALTTTNSGSTLP